MCGGGLFTTSAACPSACLPPTAAQECFTAQSSFVLLWLYLRHLVQEHVLSDYALADLADRHLGGIPAGAGDGTAAGGSASASAGSGGPLWRMRRALEAAMALGETLHERLTAAHLPVEAMQSEMQASGRRRGMRGDHPALP